MAAVTLEITPDLESELRRAAERAGLDPKSYILSALHQQLTGSRAAAVPRLTADEAVLLQEINRGLPAASWQRYRELKEKRRTESLTPGEQAELIALSDGIEEMNVQRMESIIQLAQLRRTSVDALMDELGIQSPLYD